MKTNQGGKFTEMRRGFVKILNSYKNIRKLLQKLTNLNSHHINDIDPLILHASSVKKIEERSIRHYSELQLVEEVQTKLQNYLNKSDLKMKKYDLYAHVICFLDLLLTKINQFVPKNIDLCSLTPEMMRWKLFLSQLNEAKIAMDLWIKQSPCETPKSRQSRNIISFYKTNATIKINTPSTAYMSMVETPQTYITEKQDIETDKNSLQRFFSYLKRNQSTEKIMGRSLYKRRTQYQLKKKSPQSEGLNDLGFESPIRSPKFLRKGNKSNKRVDKIEGNNKFSGSIQITKLMQSNEKPKKLFRKSTIGNEIQYVQNPIIQPFSNENKDIMLSKMQIIRTKQDPLSLYRRTNRIQRKTSIRKIKLNQNHSQSTKSDFTSLALTKISQDAQQTQLKLSDVQENQMFQQQEEFGHGGKTKINKRGRNNKKNNFSFDPDAEQPQSQNIIKKKLRKNVQIKANRQSLNVEHSNSLIITLPGPKKSIHDKKKGRRNGIINSKQMASVLSRLQLKIKQEEKLREMELKRKNIQINQKLFEELQIIDDTIIEDDSNIINSTFRKKSFNDFYRDLTRLRIDQINESKTNPWGQESAFFVMQDILRDEKSRQLQEYLQQIQMKNRTIGEMFLLKSEDENIKLQNYMLKERKLAFQSENERIKNFRKAQFYPTSQVQFIQQKFPSTQPLQFGQNF